MRKTKKDLHGNVESIKGWQEKGREEQESNGEEMRGRRKWQKNNRGGERNEEERSGERGRYVEDIERYSKKGEER